MRLSKRPSRALGILSIPSVFERLRVTVCRACGIAGRGPQDVVDQLHNFILPFLGEAM